MFALTLSASPLAAQELVYTSDAVEQCLSNAGTDAVAAVACVGVSAEQCMEATPGGYSTVAMGGCMSEELSFWDARLNAVYKARMTQAKASDAEMAELGASVPSEAEALLKMQRAWIPYRDAKCDFERSLWGGGTGGGPATVACLAQATAEQGIYIEKSGLGE